LLEVWVARLLDFFYFRYRALDRRVHVYTCTACTASNVFGPVVVLCAFYSTKNSKAYINDDSIQKQLSIYYR